MFGSFSLQNRGVQVHWAPVPYLILSPFSKTAPLIRSFPNRRPLSDLKIICTKIQKKEQLKKGTDNNIKRYISRDKRTTSAHENKPLPLHSACWAVKHWCLFWMQSTLLMLFSESPKRQIFVMCGQICMDWFGGGTNSLAGFLTIRLMLEEMRSFLTFFQHGYRNVLSPPSATRTTIWRFASPDRRRG